MNPVASFAKRILSPREAIGSLQKFVDEGDDAIGGVIEVLVRVGRRDEPRLVRRRRNIHSALEEIAEKSGEELVVESFQIIPASNRFGSKKKG